MPRDHHLLPVLATAAGITTFSAMDMLMKSAALGAGVFTALLLRNAVAALLVAPLWLARGRGRPDPEALRIHALRAGLVACMAALFFWGLVRTPLAEAIALSFIAPLLALGLAALFLKERIRAQAIIAALFGLAGVAVIAAGALAGPDARQRSAAGMGAILLSALFYAANLVVQRRQALISGPFEVAFFQNLFVGLILLGSAPAMLVLWPGQFAAWPSPAALAEIALAACLAIVSLLLLTWAYARAETQVLAPVEYTGFVWAALFGWLRFAEPVTPATVIGAGLVVAGASIAARRRAAPGVARPPAP